MPTSDGRGFGRTAKWIPFLAPAVLELPAGDSCGSTPTAEAPDASPTQDAGDAASPQDSATNRCTSIDFGQETVVCSEPVDCDGDGGVLPPCTWAGALAFVCPRVGELPRSALLGVDLQGGPQRVDRGRTRRQRHRLLFGDHGPDRREHRRWGARGRELPGSVRLRRPDAGDHEPPCRLHAEQRVRWRRRGRRRGRQHGRSRRGRADPGCSRGRLSGVAPHASAARRRRRVHPLTGPRFSARGRARRHASRRGTRPCPGRDASRARASSKYAARTRTCTSRSPFVRPSGSEVLPTCSTRAHGRMALQARRDHREERVRLRLERDCLGKEDCLSHRLWTHTPRAARELYHLPRPAFTRRG